MPAFKDKLILLSFEEEPTHTVVFDPGVEIQTQQGKNGPYDAMPVEKDGRPYLLGLGSARLSRKLKALGDGRKTITITLKKGSTTFDNDYEVKVVKK